MVSTKELGWQGGSADKGAWCQARGYELYPWDPQSRDEHLLFQVVLELPRIVHCGMHRPTYRQTEGGTKELFLELPYFELPRDFAKQVDFE